jgi:hypothetical protein
MKIIGVEESLACCKLLSWVQPVGTGEGNPLTTSFEVTSPAADFDGGTRDGAS